MPVYQELFSGMATTKFYFDNYDKYTSIGHGILIYGNTKERI